jgi:hypothetical protein
MSSYLLLIGKRYIILSEDRDIWQQLLETPLLVDRSVDPNAADLLRRLLVIKSRDRIHLREVLGHKFLQPTVPFPIVRIPFDLDARIEAWLNFFGTPIDDTLNEAGSAVLSDESLYYHLAAAAVELGVSPLELRTLTANGEEEIDPRFVAFPDLTATNDNASASMVRKEMSRSSKSKRTRSEQKSEKLRDLLAISRKRLAESGANVIQLAPCNMIQESEPDKPLSEGSQSTD